MNADAVQDGWHGIETKANKRSHFGAMAKDSREVASRIPKTAYVSENDSGTIVAAGGVYYYLDFPDPCPIEATA